MVFFLFRYCRCRFSRLRFPTASRNHLAEKLHGATPRGLATSGWQLWFMAAMDVMGIYISLWDFSADDMVIVCDLMLNESGWWFQP